jgi:flagellar basal-body rod protein FlgB
MDWMDSVSTSLLNKDLDGLWERQRAISDNIANYETPGYKTKNVSFENQLESQVSDSGDSTRSELIENIDNINPVTSVSDGDTYRADGNGVDLEEQNVNLARTEINYLYSLQEISDSFTRLNKAIGNNS